MQWRIQGGAPDARPPTDQKSLIFMQFLGNLANLYVGAPLGLAPPPTGNPGSAPEMCYQIHISNKCVIC